MARAHPTRPTYSRYSENATWHFWYMLPPELRARLNNPAERAPWVADQIKILLGTLEDFSFPRRIDVETLRSPPDYEVLPPMTERKLQRLDRFLRSTQDVSCIYIPTTLRCVQVAEDGELEPIELDGDGVFWLNIEHNEDGTFEDAPDVVRLRFNLWADIYSPLAYGSEDDNRELAALNGPRLEAFMRRLQAALPLVLYEFEPSNRWERGEVDRFGFKYPHERLAEAFVPLFAAQHRAEQQAKNQGNT